MCCGWVACWYYVVLWYFVRLVPITYSNVPDTPQCLLFFTSKRRSRTLCEITRNCDDALFEGTHYLIWRTVGQLCRPRIPNSNVQVKHRLVPTVIFKQLSSKVVGWLFIKYRRLKRHTEGTFSSHTVSKVSITYCGAWRNRFFLMQKPVAIHWKWNAFS